MEEICAESESKHFFAASVRRFALALCGVLTLIRGTNDGFEKSLIFQTFHILFYFFHCSLRTEMDGVRDPGDAFALLDECGGHQRPRRRKQDVFQLSLFDPLENVSA